MKIISGGQTGADRAALDFALAHGIECGGYCPANRKAEDGRIPAKYPLVELRSGDYRQRTELNVKEADATVIFCDPDVRSPGSQLTERLCKKHEKPYCVLNVIDADLDVEMLLEWLLEIKPAVLNVAGHRESSVPGIEHYVTLVLGRVNESLAQRLQHLSRQGCPVSLQQFPQVLSQTS